MFTTKVGSVGINDAPDAPVSAVAERDKHIVSELKRLQGIAERQEMFRKELISRLASVSREQTPIACEDKAMPSIGVPLADDLAEVARQLDETNEILEDILNHLEI